MEAASMTFLELHGIDTACDWYTLYNATPVLGG